MIIAVDLGNTAITIGVYTGKVLMTRFFMMTDKTKTHHEYVVALSDLFQHYQIDKKNIEGIILSTVVPSLKNTIVQALDEIFNLHTLVLKPNLKTGLAILTDYPSEVGSDLVAASVGGINKYSSPLVIIDLGTATKLIALNAQKAFVGVSIAPGIQISFEALIGKASLLKEISLHLGAKKAIGKNTNEALISGILLGHTEMIIGLAKKIREELGGQAQFIFTGGHASLVKDLLPEEFIYDENLLLDGLQVIYEKNRK